MFGLAVFVYVVVAGFILVAVVRGPRAARARPSARISRQRLVRVGRRDHRAGAHPRRPRRRHDRHGGRAAAPAVEEPAASSTSPASSGGGRSLPGSRASRRRTRSICPRRRADRDPPRRRTTCIHSFWVPELAGKMDAIPGQVNTLRFTAERTRHLPRDCAPSSAGSSTQTWTSGHRRRPPPTSPRGSTQQARPEGDPASDLEERRRGRLPPLDSCAGCHTVRGTPAMGTPRARSDRFRRRARRSARDDREHRAEPRALDRERADRSSPAS